MVNVHSFAVVHDLRGAESMILDAGQLLRRARRMAIAAGQCKLCDVRRHVLPLVGSRDVVEKAPAFCRELCIRRTVAGEDELHDVQS